jgi:hypothetical protein
MLSWTAHQAATLRVLDAVARPILRPRRDPVWVFGIQKSGSTVFAKALATASGRTSLMDTPLLWDTWNAPLDAAQFARLARRHPVTFSPAVLKEPSTTFYPEAVCALTSRPRHLLLIREPAANIRSALDALGVPGHPDAPVPKDIRPAYARYFETSGMPPALAMAHRWCLAYDRPFWDNPAIGVVAYEEFLAQPEPVLARATEHLGWRSGHAVDAVLRRQHQPAGAHRNVPLSDFFGEEMLGQIRSLTASRHAQLMGRRL